MGIVSDAARQPYANRSGNSGITFYEIGPSFIRIWFKDGEGYEYDNVKPGPDHVEAMKQLAEQGQGLATYINRYVRENYARKV